MTNQKRVSAAKRPTFPEGFYRDPFAKNERPVEPHAQP